jgi:hypothetical protein
LQCLIIIPFIPSFRFLQLLCYQSCLQVFNLYRSLRCFVSSIFTTIYVMRFTRHGSYNFLHYIGKS